VNVFVRRTDIRHLDGQDTPLEEGDEVVIMPSVAGG
jgi:molybdopterin synthase sulfur carrier subunit